MKLGILFSILVLYGIRRIKEETILDFAESLGCQYWCLKTNETAFNEQVQSITQEELEQFESLPCRGPPCEFKQRADRPAFMMIKDAISSLPSSIDRGFLLRVGILLYIVLYALINKYT